MRRLFCGIGLAAVLSASLAAGAEAGTRVYVRVGPPVAIVETRPVAPGPGHVWVAGYHRWDGAAYVWVPGRWTVPPAHYTVWVPGRWVHHAAHGWYWAEGHWRR